VVFNSLAFDQSLFVYENEQYLLLLSSHIICNYAILDIGAKVTELAQEVVRSVVKSVNETVRDSLPIDTANKVVVNAEGIVPA